MPSKDATNINTSVMRLRYAAARIDQFLETVESRETAVRGHLVFLALAVESTKPNIGALLATGLALPVLAVLSNRMAPEFAIIAAVLVSAWIIHAILRR